jgi:uncharacterized protein
LISLSGRHAWIAVQASQIHVGYGDADIDLLYADPLRLTPFPGDREAWGAGDSAAQLSVPRHAGYLAQVFSHVFIDIGLAVHNACTLATK